MEFNNKPPEWQNSGAEPTKELKEKGFVAGYKPPASFFNWFWNRVSNCIKELQEKLNMVSKPATTEAPGLVKPDGNSITIDDSGTISANILDGDIVKREDLNRIEGNINGIETEVSTLKKSVSDGKKIVAEAITAKGQATNIDDAFAKMAENISNIQTGVDTSDGTAIAEDILRNKTAYVRGEKIKGKAEILLTKRYFLDSNSFQLDFYTASYVKNCIKINCDGTAQVIDRFELPTPDFFPFFTTPSADFSFQFVTWINGNDYGPIPIPFNHYGVIMLGDSKLIDSNGNEYPLGVTIPSREIRFGIFTNGYPDKNLNYTMKLDTINEIVSFYTFDCYGVKTH